jgi:hypothetical protein
MRRKAIGFPTKYPNIWGFLEKFNSKGGGVTVKSLLKTQRRTCKKMCKKTPSFLAHLIFPSKVMRMYVGIGLGTRREKNGMGGFRLTECK